MTPENVIGENLHSSIFHVCFVYCIFVLPLVLLSLFEIVSFVLRQMILPLHICILCQSIDFSANNTTPSHPERLRKPSSAKQGVNFKFPIYSSNKMLTHFRNTPIQTHPPRTMKRKNIRNKDDLVRLEASIKLIPQVSISHSI